MENFLSKNLKFLRKSKKLTQAEMQDLTGFVKNTWSNWENSISQPSIENLFVISQFLEVSIEDLLTVDLSNVPNNGNKNKGKNVPMNVPMAVPMEGKKGANVGANDGANRPIFTPSEDILQESDVIDQHGEQYTLNVYDFKGSKAAAGNVVHILQNGDKQRFKPNLYLPGLGPGIHIRIPIGGDSMHNTIKDGDKPVATLITDIANVRPGHIYLIIDKTDGIQCKRVYFDDSETLELVSDNEVYSPYKRHLNDIVAFFKVREVHTKDLRPYFNDLRKEMREIKQEMASIRRLITK